MKVFEKDGKKVFLDSNDTIVGWEDEKPDNLNTHTDLGDLDIEKATSDGIHSYLLSKVPLDQKLLKYQAFRVKGFSDIEARRLTGYTG